MDKDIPKTVRHLADAIASLYAASETSSSEPSVPIMEAERQVFLALKLIVDGQHDFNEETSEV